MKKLSMAGLCLLLGILIFSTQSAPGYAQSAENNEWDVWFFDTSSNELRIFDQTGNQEIRELPFEIEGPRRIVMSPDGQKFAWSSNEGITFGFADTDRTFTEKQSIVGNGGDFYLRFGAFSPDSQQFAIGYDYLSNSGTYFSGIKTFEVNSYSVNLVHEIEFDTNAQFYVTNIRWEEQGIYFNELTNRNDSLTASFDHLWIPGDQTYQATNRWYFPGGHNLLFSTDEVIVPAIDYTYPYGVNPEYSRNAPNVLHYFATGADSRYSNESEVSTIFSSATSGITGVHWIANGDALLIRTGYKEKYYSSLAWYVLLRDGTQIDLSQFTEVFIQSENGTFSIADVMERSSWIVPTLDGWLIYDFENGDLVNFQLNAGEITTDFWGTIRELIIVHTPQLNSKNVSGFATIDGHDWGEPLCEGALPSRVKRGSRVFLRDNFEVPLWSHATEDAFILDYAVSYITDMQVIGGPECFDNSTWWQIRYHYPQEYVGWIREAQENTYWLEPELDERITKGAPAEGYAYPDNAELACPGYLNEFALTVGAEGQVLPGDPNNLRSGPNNDADLIGQIPGEGVFTVLAGPRCWGDVLWWQVDYEGQIGWTGEGIRNIYWVQPYAGGDNAEVEIVQCENFAPSRLTVGESAAVTLGEANNVRSQPSKESELVGQIPGGERFTVLDGPVCTDNTAYWQIDYNGLIGWTAEGSGNNYWLEP